MWNKLRTHLHRHRLLYGVIIALIVIWAIIKIFFTPPLLNDAIFGTAYFDKNGELLRITLAPDDKYRLYTPLSEISPDIVRATILYEDKYFYYHPGINPIALIRATINYLSGAAHPAGASTITMQVARMKYDINKKFNNHRIHNLGNNSTKPEQTWIKHSIRIAKHDENAWRFGAPMDCRNGFR